MRNEEKILLIGGGQMAQEYAKVLSALGKDMIVVGRGNESAREFEQSTGIKTFPGGIQKWLRSNKRVYKTIVAVSEEELGNVTSGLLEKGFKSILVEKPGGYDGAQIIAIAALVKKHQATVCIGYNRRFYSSVIKAKEIIKKDGGVLSFMFEFTEWSHVIDSLDKKKEVKRRWFLHNSTHVVDLAFFLGGTPAKMSSYQTGKQIDWHPSSSRFAGAGITKNGALFSYQANWESPGRWGIEVMTKNHRLIFRPLEQLQIQQTGSVVIEQIKLNDKLDRLYKPGLYLQVQSFLKGRSETLCTISDQTEHLKLFNSISKKEF